MGVLSIPSMQYVMKVGKERILGRIHGKTSNQHYLSDKSID